MNITFTLKNGEQVMLRSDKNNYELCQIRVRTDRTSGEQVPEWEPIKWFSTLEQALTRVCDLKIRAADARSLEELMTAVREARDEIVAVWRTSL
jgi:hypothetical protein